ncbi:MAG: hypothetical protein L6367_01565 [Cellulomonas sp.]|nr:hypothetical protein [Cellulomonas sp.]
MRTPLRPVATGLLTLVLLGGCATTTASSTTSTSTSSTTSTTTGLSSGSYTATFDGTEVTLTAAYLVDGEDVTIDAGTYASAVADQAVFLVVNGGSLTIAGSTITKSGDASSSDATRTTDVSDDYNFYGLNSAVVVVGEGSTVTIEDSSITTTSSGSNAVFATNGGSATVNGVTIETSGSSSRGLDATYEGTITASDVTITTAGTHSAAIATDRGNGTITVTGTNTLNTSGDGSPLIYSTGDISVTGATGTATGSEAVVVEGKNSVELTASDLATTATHAAMLYQSFSGDAADANATEERSSLTLTDSTITSTSAESLVYVTNTTSTLTLTNSSITGDNATTFIEGAEDRWGTSGSNGGTVDVTLAGSAATGALIAGSSSTITVTLTDSSTLTGSISGSVSVTPDSTSSYAG